MTNKEYLASKGLRVSGLIYNADDELTEWFKDTIDKLVSEFHNIYADADDADI